MSFHALEVSFPLAWQPPLWRHKPANFLSHLLGHEGAGSLHSYLKKKGWITSLSSGPQNLARQFATFKVTAHLTEDGFRMSFSMTWIKLILSQNTTVTWLMQYSNTFLFFVLQSSTHFISAKLQKSLISNSVLKKRDDRMSMRLRLRNICHGPFQKTSYSKRQRSHGTGILPLERMRSGNALKRSE